MSTTATLPSRTAASPAAVHWAASASRPMTDDEWSAGGGEMSSAVEAAASFSAWRAAAWMLLTRVGLIDWSWANRDDWSEGESWSQKVKTWPWPALVQLWRRASTSCAAGADMVAGGD